MPVTYTDEVNIYNPNAIQEGIDEAGTTASAYITEVSADNGIVVAPVGKGTVNKAITSATTGWHLADVLEYIRNGVSRFWIGLKNSGDTTPTVRIGKKFVNGASDNESHMELDYHSMQLMDKANSAFLHVSDLRDAEGYANVEEVFTGDGTNKRFVLAFSVNRRTDQNPIEPYVDDSPVYLDTSQTVESSGIVVLLSAPPAGSRVKIRYDTTDENAKAFTFGSRADTEDYRIGGISFSSGIGNASSGIASFAEGHETKAIGNYSHAEGSRSVASDFTAHAEGTYCTASGRYSHAEGNSTTASGDHSHSEGFFTTASGLASHAEGNSSVASGEDSHAEGSSTVASGLRSHAEGCATASGRYSHAEGGFRSSGGSGIIATSASGWYSHAEGSGTSASGSSSHSQNSGTTAAKASQTALGSFNEEDTATETTHPSGTAAYGTYAVIVGNGTSDDDRSNALAVGWDGSATLGHGSDNTTSLKFASENRTGDFIKLYGASDANGDGIVMGAGGAVVVGSGESAQALYDALSLSPGAEATHIASDNAIDFWSNCQTIADRKHMQLDTAGTLNNNGAIVSTNNTFYADSTVAAFDRDGAAPSADAWKGGLVIRDKDKENFAQVAAVKRSSANGGWNEVGIYPYAENSSGTQIDNALVLGVKSDGSRRVLLNQAAWLSALGLNTLFKIVTSAASAEITLNAGAENTGTTCSFTGTTGYNLAAVVSVQASSKNVAISNFWKRSETQMGISSYNPSSSQKKFTITVTALFIKDGFGI